MSRRALSHLLCAGLLCGLSTPAAAQLYKWVDANGQTHYSDKVPPDAKARAQQMEAPAAAAAGQPSASDWQARDNEFRKRQAERENNESLAAAKKKQDADKRAQACQDARHSVSDIQGGVRLYRYNDQGERVFIDDNERATLLQKSQQSVANNC